MPNIVIKITYSDGTSLEQNNKSFKAMIKLAFIIGEQNCIQPLKVLFPTTGKVLYFDDTLFRSYINEELEQPDLIDQTQCEGLYRNRAELILSDKSIIDPGALWKKFGKNLILIDADEYITSPLNEKAFVEI